MRHQFTLLLLILLHLAPSKAFPPPRRVTRTRLTGCVSHFETCSYRCPDLSSTDELCEYSTWQYCSTVFSKRCECTCTRQLTLSPCFTAHISGYASLGTYRLTDQLHNGNNVYKRDPEDGNTRWLYWQGNEWKIYTSLGSSSAFSSCSHAQLKDCDGSSDYFKVTRCDSLWREDNRCGGSYMSATFPYQPAICDTAGDYPCCGGNNQCGNSQSACWCESCLNYAEVQQSCLLEQITRIPNYCDITPLDQVDTEISTQQLWNIAGVLSGSVPLIGNFFDAYFAVLDPMGPVTSPFDLVNNLVNAVNEQVTALQRCMDQQITNVKVSLIEQDFKAIIRESYFCQQYRDHEKRSCIQQLSQTFYGKLGIFEERASSYLEYEMLLPIFEAIYPIWFATVAGRLEYLKEDVNGCNFNEFLDRGREGTDTLKRWAGTWAVDSIVEQLTPPEGFDNDACKRDGGDHDPVHVFYADKKYLYAVEDRASAGEYNRGISSMQVFLKMTEKTNHWCQFLKEGQYLLNRNDPVRCRVMRAEARKIVDTVKSRLTNEYRPGFYKKFVENVDKFRKSLDSIAERPCTRNSGERVLTEPSATKTQQFKRHQSVSYKNHTRFYTQQHLYSDIEARGGRLGSHRGEGRMKPFMMLGLISVGMMMVYSLLILKRRWKYERITGAGILQL